YFASQVHLALGRTVIFDRYVYDRLLFTQQSVGQLKWLYLRLMPPTVPPPDLVLVLDVPGSVMFARKGERSPEHLESQRQILLALGNHLPHAQVVDGTLTETAIRAEVIGCIWSRCCAHWNSHRHRDGSPQGQLASGRTLPAGPPLETAHGLPFAPDRAGSPRHEREGVYEADR